MTMKAKSFIAALAVCTAVVIVSGCSKEEPVAPAQAPKSSDTAAGGQAAKPADTAAAAVQPVVEKTTAAAQPAADQAAAQANAMQDQAQGVIDKAQGLVKETKYQEALSALGQLANLKLTPEQQKLVDDLKGQIQNALAKAAASKATSALGDALGGKK
jgi:hypothetical protein